MSKRWILIADGDNGNLSLVRKQVKLDEHRLRVTLAPQAGFVLTLD